MHPSDFLGCLALAFPIGLYPGLPSAGALPSWHATCTRTLTLREGQPKTSPVSLINLLPHPHRLYATAYFAYYGFPNLWVGRQSV